MRFSVSILLCLGLFLQSSQARKFKSHRKNKQHQEDVYVEEDIQNMEIEFEYANFMNYEGKHVKTRDEFEHRKLNFKKTDDKLRKFNDGHHKSMVRHNFMSDLDPEEQRLRMGFVPDQYNRLQFNLAETQELTDDDGSEILFAQLDQDVDLEKRKYPKNQKQERTKRGKSGRETQETDTRTYQEATPLKEPAQPRRENGGVNWMGTTGCTGIHNQLACGSCWAFTAAGGLESAIGIKYGQTVKMSEQNMVDCCKDGSSGCNGGMHYSCLNESITKPLYSEETYGAYTASDSTCKMPTNDSTKSVRAQSLSVKFVDQNFEDWMTSLENGKLMMAVCAEETAFMYCSDKGIVTEEAKDCTLNHAVIASGYGYNKAGEPYIEVQNSWGTTYGDNGICRIAPGALKSFNAYTTLVTSVKLEIEQ